MNMDVRVVESAAYLQLVLRCGVTKENGGEIMLVELMVRYLITKTLRQNYITWQL